ncbi:MAG: hypothetical protein OEP45_11025, partial [Acidobacteriota bacterium]|nr:hypothetical protein [Acidobacteriota bacterium]
DDSAPPSPAIEDAAAGAGGPADVAAAAEIDLDVEIDLGELDLGERVEPERLDPVLPAAGARPPADAAGQERAPEADGEAEFTLEDIAVVAAVPEAEEGPGMAAGDGLGFELDLEETAPQAPETIAGDTIAPVPEAGPEGPEAPATAPEIRGESIKLLIEAEVLARYGMDEMAIAVLDRILRAEPREAEAMARLVRLQLRVDRADEAFVVANQLADLVAAGHAPKSWGDVCESMAERGFTLVNGRFAGAPAAPPERAEPDAAGPDAEAPAAPPETDVAAAPEPVPDAATAAEAVDAEPAARSLEEVVAGAAAEAGSLARRRPESPEDVLGEVIDEIERGGRPAEAEGTAEEAAAAAPADADWLLELDAAGAGPGVEAGPEPPSDEFVDLATELEAELFEEGGLEEDELLPSLREQSLEDIVEGFRQGMAETLSETDYDTHYNLGVAYREMGLIDEAIGEFQLAAKDERYLVQSCSLLAASFVEKNFHDLAIQWYVRAIDSPVVDPESKLGLLYELGSLLAAVGQPEAARQRFLEIYGVNSNYRDVVAKLAELPA